VIREGSAFLEERRGSSGDGGGECAGVKGPDTFLSESAEGLAPTETAGPEEEPPADAPTVAPTEMPESVPRRDPTCVKPAALTVRPVLALVGGTVAVVSSSSNRLRLVGVLYLNAEAGTAAV